MSKNQIQPINTAAMALDALAENATGLHPTRDGSPDFSAHVHAEEAQETLDKLIASGNVTEDPNGTRYSFTEGTLAVYSVAHHRPRKKSNQ